MGGGVKSSDSNSFAELLAFTLAEVLIVLGIIGIIAEMTIPTLMANVQLAELQAEYKKTYSDLNQIAQRFQSDYDMSVSEYTDSTNDPKYNNYINFKNTYPTYFKHYRDLSPNGWEYSIHPVKQIIGNYSGGWCDWGHFIQDSNGRIMNLDDANANGENGPKICVDINGEKGPNREGWDNFVFLFTTSGKVIPMGASDSHNPANHTVGYVNFSVPAEGYCNPTDYTSLKNASCAYYALLDQSPFDSKKSYWHDFLPSIKGK